MAPEEVFSKIVDKQRLVICGSEGTALLSGIMRHVLTYFKRPFNYFEHGTYIEQLGAPIAIIVADEKISAGNSTPDFLKFQHHIGVIGKISHTSANGFSSKDEYIRQYDLFADSTPKGGIFAYCEQDPIAAVLCNKERTDVAYAPYKAHPHLTDSSGSYLISSNKEKVATAISETHYLQYVSGAKEVLKRIGISSDQFYQAITTFKA